MFAKGLARAAALATSAAAVSFSVESSGGNTTSPYQYGIMFEDINNSGDGGVYAELIQNRAFQGDEIFPKSVAWWYPLGGAKLALSNDSVPLSQALPSSMEVTGGSDDTIGFWNEGFWGFPGVASWLYNGSFYMMGAFDGNISIAMVSNTTGDTLAEASVQASSKEGQWTQYHYQFQPSSDAPDSNNTLQFTMPASSVQGPLNFNLLSLFPPTYNNRPNGLRMDLMEAMAGLNPKFFRLPGGNNLEGNQPPYWWNWTETLGPLENRPGYPGTWGYETTNGLGLMEYMLWAEDLGMEIILDVWAGLWLNGTHVPQDELQPYIQSALDELEFLTGDTSTSWGSYRAELGHPEPFSINYVEVGNEDSLSDGKKTYAAYRFPMFHDAIKAAYPDMTIIASYYDVDESTGEPPYGATGDFHEYAIPVQMSSQFGYFDNYTRGHPLFLGEYAVIEYDQFNTSGPSWYEGAPRAMFPFWYGSIAEAIYLLSAERNSDNILGAAYAPGFMNLNRWEWIPDMIAFDANPANLILSTSYYVVQLLASVHITETLPTSGGDYGPAYWVAGKGEQDDSRIVKAVVYNSTGSVPFSVEFAGIQHGAVGQLTYLTAPMNASNYINENVVETHKETIHAQGSTFSWEMPEYSVGILEVGDCGGHGFGNGWTGGWGHGGGGWHHGGWGGGKHHGPPGHGWKA